MSSLFTKQLHKNLMRRHLMRKMTHATHIIQNWWRKHQLIKGKARVKVCEARIAVLERKLAEFEEYGGTLSSDEEGYCLNSMNDLF